MDSPDEPPSASTNPLPTSNHDDAIVRVASYHRRDFNLAVIHSNSTITPPESTLFESFTRDSVSTLGHLEVLPAEILTNISLLLDLQSAFQFSHVNTRAKDLIAGI